MKTYTVHVCGRCGVQLHSASVRENDDDPESYGHPAGGEECWLDVPQSGRPTYFERLFPIVRVSIQRYGDHLSIEKETTL